MIKIYNINHEKYKGEIQTNEKGTNISFRERLGSLEEENHRKKFYLNRNNSAHSSHKRINEFNEEEEENIKGNQIESLNHSFYLEEKHNYPEVKILGSGLIEVINYNKIKKKDKNKENKKSNILEFIRKSYDDQEIIDEKKLIQLRNVINFNNMIKCSSIDNRNIHNNKELFSNTLSHQFKRNIMKNLFKKEKHSNKNYHNRQNDNQNSSRIIQEDIRRNKSFISLGKENIDNSNNGKKNLEIELKGNKRLNPIKFKGNNSSFNIRQKLIKKDYLSDKKMGRLMNKIKEMIPYEEKISFFDTSNIERLNRSVFSQKINIFDKRDKDEYLKDKELTKKRLRAICQNEPKNTYNINNQINLLNNE